MLDHHGRIPAAPRGNYIYIYIGPPSKDHCHPSRQLYVGPSQNDHCRLSRQSYVIHCRPSRQSYAGPSRKDPYRPSESYMLDFHKNILVASHGNMNMLDDPCRLSWQYEYVRLPQEDPCRLSWKYEYVGIFTGISFPLLKAIKIVRLHNRDPCRPLRLCK